MSHAREGAGTARERGSNQRGARIAVALAWGLACHALFALAIGLALREFWSGFRGGLGPFRGAAALLADAALVLQFPLLHSFLLAAPGRRILARVAPLGLGRDLATTTFGAFASLQLLVVLLAWSPSGVVLAELEGSWRALAWVLYPASWLLLVRSLWDAGLGLQTGWLGWTAVLRGRAPRYPAFPVGGLFRLCRQPVYVAFALTMWTGPTLTLDRIALAMTWTIYCLVGPRFKEARFRARYGAEYEAWARDVPYALPRLRLVRASVATRRAG